MKLDLAPTISLAEELASRIELRTARVAVVGLGYVGLPLAETFAWGGYPVLGFDVDEDKVAKLNRGESYIGHICPERVAELLGRRPLRRHQRPRPLRRGRRHHHLRADAAGRGPRAGPVVHHRAPARCCGRTCARARSWSWKAPPTPARPRTCCGRFWKRAASRPAETSSSPTAPSAKTRAIAISLHEISPKSSAAWTRRACGWPWRCTSRWWTAWCRCRGRGWPRRARFWRTPTAR